MPQISVKRVFGYITVDMHVGIGIALPHNAACPLFQISRTPGTIKIVAGNQPVLYVGACAHLGCAANQNAHLAGAHFCKQILFLNVGFGVMNESDLIGRYAAGDQFIASEEYVNYLKTEYDAYACEMEGAAVAAICIKYQIPFVVIRALSDKADGNAHESYDNFIDIAGGNSCRIVMKFLKSL